MKRRSFLASMIGMGVATAAPSWAAMGSPIALGAGRNRSGQFVYCGIGKDGKVLFETPMAFRGHGFAVHPLRAQAVALARRPGAFGYVMDLSSGKVSAELDISAHGHFYGHAAFDPEGHYLYTTENNLEDSQGRLGIWDAKAGFERMGAVPTGGIGPHEVIALPQGGFAVANGGILTDPSSARAKLNIPTMEPSLSLFDENYTLQAQYALPREYHQLSIRHLAAAGDAIAIGLQWEGDPREEMPVMAIYRDGQIALIEESAGLAKNYIGSVAANGEGNAFAFSAPKAGLLLICDIDGSSVSQVQSADVYGVCASQQGFLVTAKNEVAFCDRSHYEALTTGIEWDNHLKKVTIKNPSKK